MNIVTIGKIQILGFGETVLAREAAAGEEGAVLVGDGEW